MSKKWNNSQTLKSKKGESKLSKDRFSDDSLFTINVICNTSKDLFEEYFSNKIPIVDLNNTTRSYIKEILELDGEKISVELLPFNTKEGCLGINSQNQRRITKIFNLYGIRCDEEEEILKCSYDGGTGLLYHVKKDLLRIFLRISNNRTIDILLIDPYHLVATEQYKRLFFEHRDKFKYCYSNLKSIAIFG